MSILVIVESAGKIKKINEILGNNYIVKASFGHVQDLDKKTLSIDIENNFNPLYIVSEDKLKIVKELNTISKKCKEVILATDGDREGEAIAYSLANVLKLKNPKRIIFHEITKTAILKAIQNPTIINMDMVYSQQTRRILDRLMGYKISPILWKYLSDAKSAGRVQSVVVKIINDRENELLNIIEKSYFKITGIFNKINSTLNHQLKTDTECLTLLNKITKETSINIIDIENKISIRKSSPPFITSTLQQESSIKLYYSIKKTMDIAQKLYENGLITYMRTDCPNISEDAIKLIEEFIIKKYGKNYSLPTNYDSKNSNSQDAHECIRPTNIINEDISNLLDDECNKLYNLIWKRTIASQMSNAEIEIQIIKIDLQNNKKSILFFDEQKYFISTFENILFPGYQIVYNNFENEDETISENQKGIFKDEKLKITKIKISEEFNKLPHGGRFNEANLVKYLEKNGIGRPSTYVSIITKIIDRKYVEIKDIEGIEKQSKQFELSSKFKIVENIKKIIIGKENKKIIITEMGKLVNEFLIKNFEPIININFTADFETLLDKVSIGKANWITILRNYYDMFNPIVEKLLIEKNNDKNKLLGITEENKEIYMGTGKFGPYIKIFDDNLNKWIFTSIKDIPVNQLTLAKAIELLSMSTNYPKLLGTINNINITLNKGSFGLFLKYNNKNISITDENITIEKAIELIQNHKETKSFKKYNKIYNIKNGQYGNYIQIISGKKKENISIPSKYNIDTITLDDILKIINSKT